jgi:XRE family transcriptional regulator, regulator of sulfur utilization
MSIAKRFDFSVIRTLRMKRGFTAEQLAKKAGLTRATIAKIEGGDGNPTIETIESLSNVFNLSSSEFIRLAELTRYEQAAIKSILEEGIEGEQIWFPDFEIIRLRAKTGLCKIADPKDHENTAEVCLVLSGRVKVKVAGNSHELAAGMAIRYKAMQAHQFDIIEEAEFLLMHHSSGNL